MTDTITQTLEYVKHKLAGESSGHDWWHIYRVHNLAKYLAKHEGGDTLVIELAALLHDISDYKLNGGDDTLGPILAKEFLLSIGVDTITAEHVADIIYNMSFKGALVTDKMQTLEGQIVQDADRLDAIGAIGIGRTFAYGGHKGRIMYDPTIEPTLHSSFAEYKNANSGTINHFYEKLLLLKDRLNTPTAKQLATRRHQVMEDFLTEFFHEWHLQEA
jgi:uncharacterized protein